MYTYLYYYLDMGLGGLRALGRFFQKRLKNTQKHIEFCRNRVFSVGDLRFFLERAPFTKEFFTKASKMTEICQKRFKIEGYGPRGQ